MDKIQKYAPVLEVFDALKSTGMTEDFCTRNGISERDVHFAMDLYTNADAYMEKHNEEYIAQAMENEKEYLDHVLKAVDPAVVLDEDQRKVVLTDEDYCLVIAGAGAGKTTTVAAKVKYLVDKKGVKPSQILVVSFTNKAVKELKEKNTGLFGDRMPDCHISFYGQCNSSQTFAGGKTEDCGQCKPLFCDKGLFQGFYFAE